MKRVLILGTLAGQVDAVDSLRARGVAVDTCGHRAEGPGVTEADAFHLVDITDPAAVADLARREGYDVVYSVGSDIAMPTVTEVSEQLGLPHFHGSDLTRVLRQKELMRAALAHLPWGSVEHRAVQPNEDFSEWQTYPAIVKPDDSQGQRGITVIAAAEELAPAIALARSESRSGVVVIEELLQGPEVSVHVIVSGGKVLWAMPTSRHVWDGPLVGIPEAHGIPVGDAELHAQLRALVEDCVAALEVSEGPLYFQTFVTARGPRVVEIASRLDGCHLWRLIREATGFDLLDAVLGRLLGDEWPDFDTVQAPQAATLEFFLEDPAVPVTAEVRSRFENPAATFVEWHVADGELPRKTNDVVARLGYQIFPGA